MAIPGRRARSRQRLSRSGEFERVYRRGDSHSNRFMVLYSFPREQQGEDSRLGISAGRKLGGAVERNRVKRVLREAYQEVAEELPPAHDYVLVARPELRKLVEAEGTPGAVACLREVIRDSGLTRNT
ncbi:MAG: ribonuclease protein component [Solirubrobacterales bacterium]|jgi:ribonuclease P protein component|nr:ribonuclease protein component [Solirubrobacterales bacterium]